MLTIEVVYAMSSRQYLLTIEVNQGVTLEAAIEKSGIIQYLPNQSLSGLSVGVFGKLRQLSDLVRDKDRIEIYRPLPKDPKQLRRERALKYPI